MEGYLTGARDCCVLTNAACYNTNKALNLANAVYRDIQGLNAEPNCP